VNTIDEIQKWYHSQCDGVWEHGECIEIGTLDNPGWRVRISLHDTELKTKNFLAVEHLEPELDWIRCWVEEGTFNGAGGPHKLEEILQIFLNWAKQP